MKKIISYIIFFSILLFTLSSCKNNLKENLFIKVKNANYKMYDISGERGYSVSFELKENSQVPIAISLNKVKQNILPQDADGLMYNINVITQTQKIYGYKVEKSEEENGFWYKKGDQIYFQPVNFNLISK